MPARTIRSRLAAPVAVALATAVFAVSATAGTIAARVTSAGQPVRDAVLYAEPLDGQSLEYPANPTGIMDQKSHEFVPHVLPVLRGTSVRFPNSDETRHHVYSFSEAKTFQLRLYKGGDADPVEFDRIGTVTMGCNIHDWMLGYVLVLDTPMFDRTGEDGHGQLDDMPPGRYRVHLWHPRLPAGEAEARTVGVKGDAAVELAYELALEAPRERAARGFGNESDDAQDEFDRY